MKKIIDYIKKLFVKKDPFDRNYHHYVMTEHCRNRMKERKILYKDINVCFKYGKKVANQIILELKDIPKDYLKNLEDRQYKHLTNKLPLVITLKFDTNIITTVYKGNKSIMED